MVVVPRVHGVLTLIRTRGINMAQEFSVTQSLFGLNPDSLLRAERDRESLALDKEAMAYTQLTPMQQATYMQRRGGMQAGQAIGRGIAGMLGVETENPQIKLAQTTQGIMRDLVREGFDPNNTYALRKEVAKRLAAAGFAQEGAALAQETAVEQVNMAAKEADTIKKLTDAKNQESPFEQLTKTGKFTPASLALFKKTGNVADLALADDKYEKVETDEGVWMVNKTDPTDKLRLGDVKQSQSTDQWIMNKWNFLSQKAVDPKTGKRDWSRLSDAERDEAKALASSDRLFGKQGARAMFNDLAQDIGIEEGKALAAVLRAEAFDKEFTAITKTWLPKGDTQSAATFFAALRSAGEQGVAPSMVYNFIKDPQAARYISSAIRYVNSILRRESGAAVTESEWQRYGAGYIPMPGDSPEAVAEKERARKVWPQTEIDTFGPNLKTAYKNAKSRDMDMTPGAPKIDTQDPLVAAGVNAKRQGDTAYRQWWGTLSKEEKDKFRKAMGK